MKLSYIFVALFFLFFSLPTFAQTNVDLSNNLIIVLPSNFAAGGDLTFSDEQDGVHINILEMDVDEEFSKQELIDEVVSGLKQQWSSYVLLSKGDFNKVSYSAVFIKGKMYSDEADVNIMIDQYLILDGNKLYNINCACPENAYAKYAKVFDNIAGSFRKK